MSAGSPIPELRDLSAPQVQELVVSLGQKPYRARQVLQWLYLHGAASIEDMTTLSKAFRSRLADAARLEVMEPALVETSTDGTRKMLFSFSDGAAVESVLIPEVDHHTLCVSSQVGCKMGCAFCHTATLGFRRNLRPSEILGQVLAARRLVDQDRPLTNLVFMGMGEPLDNLANLSIALSHILGSHGLAMSQRKVTVSTVGLVDKLPALAAATPAALAVSLSAADDALREKIMPVNRRWNLAALKKALAAYPLKPTRRITFEYVLLGGVNDRPEQAAALAKWLKGLPAKVNLIAFNPHQGAAFDPPTPEAIGTFQNELISRHITAMVRKSRGADISAACGQLAAKNPGGEAGS
ncbi:MAG: 23S rRNA (adenine(2503)-C(2))-methyltransferase RlmN [Desulfarculaceae bacterium]|nr:23S rRNA (adenine(2503)-C(2))-methyltransferase RlmN [Desulfarculaceae bacterium]MCF8072510.1 23S rRNA (adenine(2503)-C(2))-methyltransferase RlmN [Desulfarculaceae bacterium]MCF8103651.1 23S rRNA (adenine(2503)-C(2))-methyltransferase RlmN [Desulfarculaceae bacterium]MCF8117051.1 23S rRNA (adenine(2503)-C(2))-methyltransferase RlmN [Desulfarculaceae bacterium]